MVTNARGERNLINKPGRSLPKYFQGNVFAEKVSKNDGFDFAYF